MKTTKRQLRKIIRESIVKEIFGFGKNKTKPSKSKNTIDLKKFGRLVGDMAFKEDVGEVDLSDPSNLEWIASSDEEIKRIGKKYKRPSSEVQAFLSLSKEERKKLLK